MALTFLFHEQAEFLRESSGSNIEATLRKAVKVLALFRIPHYVCGGFAVQEHGYARKWLRGWPHRTRLPIKIS